MYKIRNKKCDSTPIFFEVFFSGRERARKDKLFWLISFVHLVVVLILDPLPGGRADCQPASKNQYPTRGD
jgi:hypothetical protein